MVKKDHQSFFFLKFFVRIQLLLVEKYLLFYSHDIFRKSIDLRMDFRPQCRICNKIGQQIIRAFCTV